MKKPKSPIPSPDVADEMAAPGAVEAPAVKEEAPPTYVKLGVTLASVCNRLRVIDAETGDMLSKVIEADADNGRVVRYVVEKGALVREGDRFKTVEEERPIRIEWSTGNQKDSF